ncbi:hypothetical protein M430DRAFT_173642 [Amorphotheca resinae ATCC 22711]|uniref:Uncharacterized protein n=1 Tax=Amorphotheca resinae ATCC 22711 TaxID=857342 RepID=A0A2T3AVE7_AMORE|nr:hypothetical protein M430DRAFT_173642 [Amorphotheca resinae ATCC 22711]PSS12650.1 hypothetical protein M430DRAFT_173642 [Amorphotheca resinae ATCC 22711]
MFHTFPYTPFPSGPPNPPIPNTTQSLKLFLFFSFSLFLNNFSLPRAFAVFLCMMVRAPQVRTPRDRGRRRGHSGGLVS